MSCSKVTHFTSEQAEEHAQRLRDAGQRRAAAYQCRWCHGWHVTKGGDRQRPPRPKGFNDRIGRRGIRKKMLREQTDDAY